jgi:hypothetical protein
MKDAEIYNVFNTEKLLNRPPKVMITNTSGVAGIAFWINTRYHKKGSDTVSKDYPGVVKIKDWIDRSYAEGRVTSLTDAELEELVNRFAPELTE